MLKKLKKHSHLLMVGDSTQKWLFSLINSNNKRMGTLMMGWIEFLTVVVGFALLCLGLTIFVFALIGIQKVFDDYKESKLQREYGKKLKEETKRNQWENMERLRDRVLLLEEIVKLNGIEKSVAKVDEIISGLDYDARYNF